MPVQLVSEYDVALAKSVNDLPIALDGVPEEWTEHFAALCHHIENRLGRPREFTFALGAVRDLVKMQTASPERFRIVMAAVENYPASYSDIARLLGVSKVAVFLRVKKITKTMPWVVHLFRRQDERLMKPRSASSEVARLVYGDKSGCRKL